MQKKKILFIDRDGTIIVEPSDNFQVDSLEKLAFLPKVIYNLRRIIYELDYQLVMVTNQDGMGTDAFPAEKFWQVHNKMLQILENEGITFTDICIDTSFEHQNSPTRKPNVGMLTNYLQQKDELEWKKCFVIGDRLTDMQLAENLGLRGIWIAANTKAPVLLPAIAKITTDWDEIYTFLKYQQGRVAQIHRKTLETEVFVALNLDKYEPQKINTGIGFFDHMLAQIAKHAQISLQVEVEGDFIIDEHHTIEDTALTLGQAFAQALGSKHGIARYGHFTLPMDEAQAQVAIDFSGRSFLVWKGTFHREKVGYFPTEMVEHFFQSFVQNALCSLHVNFYGKNDHHQIEAIFKAFAKAIRMAIQIINNDLPSTKGAL
ncbi:MAG: bifunctional histidinol-phosphatase/imidazoleglycerol-phosphate dehydratase HisB [Microscillaceae bacterium]|nr:bifunctional histidinol-phosphatase/imidazoleglycerol-phosphate dehydratase HisB [Microscillaceae bacterium]MDW8461665.1 bifunctional histidinol-phosphatase/imidazoleglycerol-phosphate dehydratase HisB [Cytophagales bacterium]